MWQYSESWSIRVNAESIDYIKIINKFNIINAESIDYIKIINKFNIINI